MRRITVLLAAVAVCAAVYTATLVGTSRAREPEFGPPAGAAPMFALNTPSGGSYDLALELKTHRAIVVDFWSCECAPCGQELPRLDALSARLRSRGLGVVCVNPQDDPRKVEEFWRRHRLSMPVVVHGAGVAERYRVAAYPTNVVVGRDGKLIALIEGFDEAALRKALASVDVD